MNIIYPKEYIMSEDNVSTGHVPQVTVTGVKKCHRSVETCLPTIEPIAAADEVNSNGFIV